MIRELTEQVPSHDPKMEQAVLGVLMIRGGRSHISRPVKREWFYTERNQTIYSAIESLEERGAPVEIHSVANRLIESGDLELAGGLQYLQQLLEAPTQIANGDYYVSEVVKHYESRQLRYLLVDAASELCKRDVVASDLASTLTQSLSEIGKASSGGSIQIGKAIEERLREREQPECDVRIATGLQSVDSVLNGGVQAGNLVVVAGLQSSGKTALATSFGVNASAKGDGVFIVSLEMSRAEMSDRVLSLLSGTPSTNHVANESVLAAVGPSKRLPFTVADVRSTPNLSELASILAACRSERMKHPDLKVVIVDYLQLINPGLPHTVSEASQIGHVTRQLKLLAIQLDVAIVLLAQLNRTAAAENPDAKTGRLQTPRLSTLKGSSSIEQDADTAMIVWRPYPEDDDKVEVYIGKQRSGPRKVSVKVGWQKEIARFCNSLGGGQ